MAPDDEDRQSTSSAEGAPAGSTLIERLVAHFVSSKRSLSATTHVWRANEIVASARIHLEGIATLRASNKFLLEGIAKQSVTLRSITYGVSRVLVSGRADFNAVLKTLDVADARIRRTIHLLKTIIVDPALRPDDEEPKSLYDFVDEQGVDEFTQVFRNCIQQVTAAQNEFAATIDKFDNQLKSVEHTLKASGQMLDAEHATSTTSLFQSLTSHATEMADLLQSLVRHYDLCLTALRHTEGGGEAIAQTNINLPTGLEVQSRNTSPQPITDEEREEMLKVIDSDADQVDDVAREIQEAVSEMETQCDQIVTQLQSLTEDHSALAQAATMLGGLGQDLPKYIKASSTFQSRWNEQKERIEENLEGLAVVRDIYDGFLRAYDGLIIEIIRRQDVHSQMNKVITNAMKKLEQLEKSDLDERNAFTQGHGEYLPSDIWQGLTQEPRRMVFQPVEQGALVLPQLAQETVQKAKERTAKK